MDVELPVDPGQVELDRLWAEEEAGRDVTVGQALRDEKLDLELLRRELLVRSRIAGSKVLAAGAQFDAGSFRPRP